MVSEAIKTAVKVGQFAENMIFTADFVDKDNMMFDILNIRTLYAVGTSKV